MVEFALSLLRIMEVTLPLTEQFAATLDKNDPAYERRLGGMQKMKTGAATMITGCLTMLTEVHLYQPLDLKFLANSLTKSVPGILPQLSPDQQNAIRQQIKSLPGRNELSFIQTELQQLSTAVNQNADTKP